MTSVKKVVIIGAGNGGVVAANQLAKSEGVKITVIDKSPFHVYQPGLVDMLFDEKITSDSIRKETRTLLYKNIDFVQKKVIKADIQNHEVVTDDGNRIGYDYLIISPGVTEKNKFGFPPWHDIESITKIRDSMGDLNGKNVVVGYYGLIKCPAAPFEISFMLKRKYPKAKVTLLNPVSQPPKLQVPMANLLGQTAKEMGIQVKRGFKLSEVKDNLMVSEEGEKVQFDYGIIDSPIKVHKEFEDLSDSTGLIPTDKFSLEFKDFDNVFVIGDATNITFPPKTGAMAHFEAVYVSKSILSDINGQEKTKFDGRAMCAVYAGINKGMLVYMDYEKSTAQGRNLAYYVSKKMFMSLYWASLTGSINSLLEGLSSAFATKAIPAN
ncbi:NAD(P)/FAD-dependent oxidoreductase [Sulfuracidifex metallicus]|uniref:NAD(P)/FAD-dependent oxidoreductase n=1 Tax=Sulfuracidifex metallicus TaxID=47303 RepID=UPI002276A1B2|nr:FAD-dependent oxidoreductase [Sulfuracidifex metallicus]MCY0850827.1 FAD-dependent oxidoreductase [Sulfuracidifex metallicus]